MNLRSTDNIDHSRILSKQSLKVRQLSGRRPKIVNGRRFDRLTNPKNKDDS